MALTEAGEGIQSPRRLAMALPRVYPGNVGLQVFAQTLTSNIRRK